MHAGIQNDSPYLIYIIYSTSPPLSCCRNNGMDVAKGREKGGKVEKYFAVT